MARYGDLVWDFSRKKNIKVKNAFQCAKLAIQGYTLIVEENLISDLFELKISI